MNLVITLNSFLGQPFTELIKGLADSVDPMTGKLYLGQLVETLALSPDDQINSLVPDEIVPLLKRYLDIPIDIHANSTFWVFLFF